MSNHPGVPGDPTKTATVAIQTFHPINQIHQHLCAFNFYAQDMTRQIEAYHYCTLQNEEMRQCLIYDKPESDGKLIGLEYVILENLFMMLPDEEKLFLTSYEYEVKSDLLLLSRIPETIARQDLDKVGRSYGKKFHFWQVDKGDNLPLGLPQVMFALTRDGQLYDNLAGG